MITDINQFDLHKQYTCADYLTGNFKEADYLTWNFKERVELRNGWIHKMSPAMLDAH
jgi:hypothetical protein